MDPDDFSNSTKLSDEVNTHDEDFYERLLIELFTLVGLISTAANCLIIFVILKYKNLRQEVTNMIVVHLNTLQAVLYLVASPLTSRLLRVAAPMGVLCVFEQIELGLLFVICLILVLLVCDSHFKLYRESAYSKFCRVYKFVLVAIYVCTIALYSYTAQFCFPRGYLMNAFLMITVFATAGILILLAIVMNIIHACKKRQLMPNNKKNVGLVIANMFLLLWRPTLVLTICAIFVIYSNVLLIIAVTFGFSNPIFNFLYFFFYDSRFNVFIKTVFKCQCNDYENDDLEDQPVTYSDVNGVQITKNE